MQLDCRYFLSICLESEGKVNSEGYCDPDPYEYKEANQITSSNHIDQCKQILLIGMQLIDANMCASLLILPIVKLEHLFLSPLPP